MDANSLIPLPVFDAVARSAIELLLKRQNVAVVAAPGAGASSLALRIQDELSSTGIPCVAFDCCGEGEWDQRISGFSGPNRQPGQFGIIIVDHAASLALVQLQSIVARLSELATGSPTSVLWLGALDTRIIKSLTNIQLNSDTRTHLCLPELDRDDLLRLYRVIATRGERQWGQWGEAMLYFVLDWCGNDLVLVEQLVEYFYGNWAKNIYDESVEECLHNWLVESSAVKRYRDRFSSLSDACKKRLRLMSAGGKLVSHRPEIHLETCEEVRALFLSGFLCTDLLPGYYQFRNLLARYVVDDQIGTCQSPVNLLRRSANGRVNTLLQDVEVALRAMLRCVFCQMPTDELKQLLSSRKTEQKLYDPELHRTLLEWSAKIPVAGPFDAKAELIKLLKEEREKFETTNNLWTKICATYRANLGAENNDDEPTPEDIVGYLTFSELSDLLQSLAERVFLDKPRSNRMVDIPKKRWPDYLAKVRRLRNEAAHLRNIGFQDIEDLLEILDEIRKDQLDFLKTP